MSSGAFAFEGVQWTRVRALGKGAFGEAFLCAQAAHPEVQAVTKTVNIASMTAKERDDAQQEVRVLAQLQHPNIVRFMGSFVADGRLHILMEYCNAGDLEALVKRQKGAHLAEETIAALFLQVASALSYLHGRRILHRDLKSQNIFLTRPGPTAPLVAKLGDFGIATVLRSTLALAKTICGTPYYFSPELCLNRPYNNKSDIWSLGIILYEMAALQYPFDASSMKGLMQRILQGKFAPLPGQYSPALNALVAAMLQQKVDRRADIRAVLASSFAAQHSAALQSLLRSNALEGGASASGPAASRPPMISAPIVDPRDAVGVGGSGMRVARPPGTAAGKHRSPIDHDGNAHKALLRRLDMERAEMERRGTAEQRRFQREADYQQRNAVHRFERAAAVRRLEMDRLEDVGRRVEMCSYEEQQKYVQEGWGVVQASRDRQEDRRRALCRDDEQVDAIRREMQDMEAKLAQRRAERAMPSPPAGEAGPGTPRRREEPSAKELAQLYKNRVNLDSPWNRGRAVPLGFTPESWAAHQQIERRLGSEGSDGSPAQASPPQPLDLRGMRFAGSGAVRDIDVDGVLQAEQARLAGSPAYREAQQQARESDAAAAARQLWQQQLERIRAAERTEGPPPTGGRGPATEGVSPSPASAKPPRPRPRKDPHIIPVSDMITVAEEPDGTYEGPYDAQFAENDAYAADIARALAAEQCYHGDGCEDGNGHASGGFGDDGWDAANDVEERILRRACGLPDDDDIDEGTDASARVHESSPQRTPPAAAQPPRAPSSPPPAVVADIYFNGRPLPLPGDTPAAQLEALQHHLTAALGGARSFAKLRQSLEDIQNADVDEALADSMLSRLEELYGTLAPYVDLMMQFMVLEGALA